MSATESDRTPQVPELTGPQLAAVDALIGGASDADAASAAGVHRSTLNNWKRHNPAFIVALNQRRCEIWRASSERLRALLPDALARIESEIADRNSPGGLRAALKVIETGISSQNLRVYGPTDAAVVLDGIARKRPGPTVDQMMNDIAKYGENSGPITDTERRDTLSYLRAQGAFDES
jgi:hypothetical protein